MVNLGQKVFAMGGVTQTQHTVKDIEVFDAGSKSWSLHSSTLLSKSTDDLAVTELPSSSVSCNKDCKCGVRSGARIVGGTDAEVIPKKNKFILQFILRLGTIHGWDFCSLRGRPDLYTVNVLQHWFVN